MKLHPILRGALWPFSVLYAVWMRLREWLYRAGLLPHRRLEGVVISVGNLTLGGTGKTPFVLWLAERLAGEGKLVGILSRGYRGRGAESDEVSLLERKLGAKARLGVGPNRYKHGRVLEELGIEWFLLDDGFQHLRLARDVDIVLIDSTDPFGSGLLPAGRRREPKAALRRADMVVITRGEHAPAVEAVVRRFTHAPVFYATTHLEEVRGGTHSRVEAAPGGWLGKRVFAFCGVGNPEAFFGDVRRWGMDLAGQMAFPDHHRYTQRDCEEIFRRAIAAGAEALVATEKDAYNLGTLAFERLPLYHCHATMRPLDEEQFWNTLQEILDLKLGGAP